MYPETIFVPAVAPTANNLMFVRYASQDLNYAYYYEAEVVHCVPPIMLRIYMRIEEARPDEKLSGENVLRWTAAYYQDGEIHLNMQGVKSAVLSKVVEACWSQMK